MNSLLDIATDPKQYDRQEVDFKGVKGLEDPHRRHFLHYVESVHPSWKGQTVLDIGAGSGWLMKYVKDNGAKEVVGFDPSFKNIDLAKNTFGVNVELSSLGEFNPPYNNYFDVAIAIYVLTHVFDLDSAFNKISNLLKTDGELIIIVSEPGYAKREKPGIRRDYEYLENDKYNTFVVRNYNETGVIADIVRNLDAYKDSANRSGLELVKTVGMIPSDHLANAYEKHKKLQDQKVVLSNLMVFKKK